MTDNDNFEAGLGDESRDFVEKALRASLIAEASGFPATASALDAMAREQARLSLPCADLSAPSNLSKGRADGPVAHSHILEL